MATGSIKKDEHPIQTMLQWSMTPTTITFTQYGRHAIHTREEFHIVQL